MKDLYFKTLREQRGVLLVLSVVFVAPDVVFRAAGFFLPQFLVRGGVGGILRIAFSVWKVFLPFAAWHSFVQHDTDIGRRLAFKDTKLVMSLYGLYLMMVVLCLILVVAVFVGLLAVTGNDSDIPGRVLSTLAFLMLPGLLIVDFRLLLAPVIAIERRVPIRVAAKCSNSIATRNRKELGLIYLAVVAVPRLLFVFFSPRAVLVVEAAVSFILPSLSVLLMLAAATAYAPEIDTCSSGVPDSTEPEGA